MTPADLLHLVDRAERGSLLAAEATQLRQGIRQLARATPGQPCTSLLTGAQLTAPHTARLYATRRKATR